MDLKDYVLSPFSELEREGLETILPKSAEAVETWLLQGCEKAMSRFNGTLWAPPKPEPAAEPSQDL
jgi:peptidyl-tRNA hydrolase